MGVDLDAIQGVLAREALAVARRPLRGEAAPSRKWWRINEAVTALVF